jgi:hypothetical protein
MRICLTPLYLSTSSFCHRTDPFGQSAPTDFILGLNEGDVLDEFFVVSGEKGYEESLEQAGHGYFCENKLEIGRVRSFWHPDVNAATSRKRSVSSPLIACNLSVVA